MIGFISFFVCVLLVELSIIAALKVITITLESIDEIKRFYRNINTKYKY
jgi:hypothetical protein